MTNCFHFATKINIKWLSICSSKGSVFYSSFISPLVTFPLNNWIHNIDLFLCFFFSLQLITAKIGTMNSSMPSSPDSSSDSSGGSTPAGLDGPNLETENCLPGVVSWESVHVVNLSWEPVRLTNKVLRQRLANWIGGQINQQRGQDWYDIFLCQVLLELLPKL